ncbi:hypothetical protein KR074_003426, partial [Drosophila pseudoananassae]
VMFTNHINQFKLISILKNGKYGIVYKGTELNTNKSIAIKKVPLDEKIENIDIMCKEIFNCRQFKHPNIKSILHSFIWKENLYVIYPFMCFGDCQTLLQNVFKTGFPETLIALILRDVISALIYIHSQHFVHGAIKAQNILLNSKKAMISNFRGCRTFIKHGKIEQCLYGLTNEKETHRNWTAPEVLHQNLYGYTEKIDIYSIGITSCEMANGFQPFKDTEPTLMYTDKIRGNMSLVLDSFRTTDNKGNLSDNKKGKLTSGGAKVNNDARENSDDFNQFVEICINKNPIRRWNASKLMTHSFLKQCRNSTMSEQLKDLCNNFSTF